MFKSISAAFLYNNTLFLYGINHSSTNLIITASIINEYPFFTFKESTVSIDYTLSYIDLLSASLSSHSHLLKSVPVVSSLWNSIYPNNTPPFLHMDFNQQDSILLILSSTTLIFYNSENLNILHSFNLKSILPSHLSRNDSLIWCSFWNNDLLLITKSGLFAFSSIKLLLSQSPLSFTHLLAHSDTLHDVKHLHDSMNTKGSKMMSSNTTEPNDIKNSKDTTGSINGKEYPNLEISSIAEIKSDRIYLLSNNNLHCILFSTPTELLNYYLHTHQYPLAITHCIKHSLNQDIVHKHHWQYKFNQDEIDTNILNSINDKSWVLNTCTHAFLNNIASIRAILKYGFQLTDRLTVSQMDSEINLFLESLETGSTLNTINDGWPTNTDLFLYRLKFLTHLDRLQTFETIYVDDYILGNKQHLARHFQSFANQDLFQFASLQAGQAHLENLDLLLTRHTQLLPYRFSLMALIPHTVDPDKLSKFIPKLDLTGSCCKYKHMPWRKPDWTESASLQEFLDLLQPPTVTLTPYTVPEPVDVLRQWFHERILGAERLGMIKYAIKWCVKAHHVGISFTALEAQLKVLDGLVHLHSSLEYMTLNDLNHLSLTEFIDLNFRYMDSRNVCGVVTNIKAFGSCDVDSETVLMDRLVMYCQAYPDILLSLVKGGVLGERLHELVEKCAYTDTLVDVQIWADICYQLELLNQPDPAEDGWLTDDLDDLDFDSDEIIKPMVTVLKSHVDVASFLKSHGIQVTLHQVRCLREDDGDKHISRWLRSSTLLPTAADTDWTNTLQTLLEMVHDSILTTTRQNVIIEMVKYALSQSRYSYTQTLFFPPGGASELPMTVIEELVLHSAIEFYDNAENGDKTHGLLAESLQCCGLLNPNLESIRKHIDLITVTHELCTTYHLKDGMHTVIPIQIRIHEDRIRFVEMLLECQPHLYTRVDLMHQYAKLLCGDEDLLRIQILVLVYVGRVAISRGDLLTAYRHCVQLIEYSVESISEDILESVWGLLIECVVEPNDDLNTKLQLCSYMCLIATKENLSRSLDVWRQVYAQWILESIDERDSGYDEGDDTFEDMSIRIHERIQSMEMLDGLPELMDMNVRLHPFYQPVGSEIGHECIQPLVMDSRLKLPQTKYRLLQAQMAVEQVVVDDFNNHYMMAQEFHHIDAFLTISHLLSSCLSIDQETQFFNNLTQNQINNQLAIFYFTIKPILFFIHTPLCDLTINKCFALPTTKLYNILQTIIKTHQHSELYSQQIQISKQYVETIQYYRTQVRTNQAVLLRDCLLSIEGVDGDRIHHDVEYRKQLVLKLVWSCNQKAFESALMLARDDDIPTYQFLFTTNVSVNDLEFDFQTNLPLYISMFDEIRSQLREMHSVLVTVQPFVLGFYYRLVMDGKELNDDDRKQVTLRLDILQELTEFVELDLNLAKILDSHSGLDEFVLLCQRFVGVVSFKRLERLITQWVLLQAISWFDNDTFVTITTTHDAIQFKSQVLVICISKYLESLDWSQPESVIYSTIEDIRSIFGYLTPVELGHLIKILVMSSIAVHISVHTRLDLIQAAVSVLDDEYDLIVERKHVGLVKGIMDLVDLNSNTTIPNSFITRFDECGVDVDKILHVFETFIGNGQSTPWYSFELKKLYLQYHDIDVNLEDVYSNAITKQLTAESVDIDLVDTIVGGITQYSIINEHSLMGQSGSNEMEGWMIDDFEPAEESEIQIAIDLIESSLKTTLSRFLFGESAPTLMAIVKLSLTSVFEKIDDDILLNLSDKESQSVEYFIYGLLCANMMIQTRLVSEFNMLEANYRYRTVYHILIGLGLIRELTVQHQQQAMDTVITNDSKLSSILISILISTPSLPHVQLVRSWLQMSKGILFGFRSWKIKQYQILHHNSQQWDFICKPISTHHIHLDENGFYEESILLVINQSVVRRQMDQYLNELEEIMI
ncbi:hypothetical protein HDV02_004399 [Globomyces sp. JEL0801]|nr:hypothetical protein HDV02_004399 [Globomyces sp. JEL0801]